MVADKIKFRVRYSDTDSYGVVYYANYLRWAEAARTEFFRKKTGRSFLDYEKENIAFPFVHVEIDYMSSLKYDDEFVVRSELEDVGRSSISMRFSFLRGGIKIVDIKTVMVCVKNRSIKKPVPEEIKDLLR